MTGLFQPGGDGGTALSEEDRQGLLPSHVATREDLFDAEQRNIAVALLRSPPSTWMLLDDKYLRDLHRAMFHQVWAWAGRYRRRETNIGVEPSQIAVAVRVLVDDTRAWVEFGTYDRDELAARFHHRLVQIHPFPNGNGGHGRIAADHLLRSLGAPPFSWGRHLAADTAHLRLAYRRALERADGGDIANLVSFCRA